MKTLIPFITFLCFIRLSGQNVIFDWATHLSGNNIETVNTMAVDDAGNVYAAGQFATSINFPTDTGTFSLYSANVSGFMCKLKSNGKLDWAIQLGGTVREVVYDGYGGILCIGTFAYPTDFDPGIDTLILTPTGSHDTYICKIDTSGSLNWVKQIGGTGQYTGATGESMSTDKNGNICFIGTFAGKVDFDPGPAVFEMSTGSAELFILKLNAQGQFLYAGKIGTCYPAGIRTDSENNILISGFFPGPFDVDPGSGEHLLYSMGHYDGFILKLDSNANFLWGFPMAGQGYNYINGVAVDVDDNIIVTGGFEGVCDFDIKSGTHNLYPTANKDAFISKYKPNGNLVWAKQFSSTNIASGLSVFALQNGTIISTGYFMGTCDFDPGSNNVPLSSSNPNFNGEDAFVSALTKNGNYLYAGQIGVTGYTMGISITAGINASYYVAGFFEGTIDVNPNPPTINISATDYTDSYVCKLSVGSTVGIKESDRNSLTIYPNPNSGKFKVDMPIGISNPQVFVTDLWGRDIPFQLERFRESMEISISGALGIYLIKIFDDQRAFAQRVMVY